jgi:hypothetical protein
MVRREPGGEKRFDFGNRDRITVMPCQHRHPTQRFELRIGQSWILPRAEQRTKRNTKATGRIEAGQPVMRAPKGVMPRPRLPGAAPS